MPAVKEHSPTQFSKILEIVEKFQVKRAQSWYRGVGNASYSLVPTLARRAGSPTPSELRTLERGIANSFTQRSPPFVKLDSTAEWPLLFFMQHYGIPTRLLDWSESPFVALYFALTSVERNKDGEATSDAALWLCDPVSWNHTALSHISFSGGILDEHCEEIKAYSPSSDVDQRGTIPVMIYGTHNSPRIVAQRGVFALFGKGTEGMEKIYKSGKFAAETLQKMTIGKQFVDGVLSSLYRKGFVESTIFPDLGGLALEIRRMHGFR